MADDEIIHLIDFSPPPTKKKPEPFNPIKEIYIDDGKKAPAYKAASQGVKDLSGREPQSWEDVIRGTLGQSVEIARPFVSGGAVIGGGAAGALTLNPWAAAGLGVGSGIAADSAMQSIEELITGKPSPQGFVARMMGLPPGSIMDKITGGTEMGATNEVGARVMYPFIKGGQWLLKSPAPANPFIEKLGLSVSQATGSRGAKTVEEFVTPNVKSQQLKDVGASGRREGGGLIQDTLGATEMEDPFNSNAIAVGIRNSKTNQYQASVLKSDAAASRAENLAKLNKVDIPITTETPRTSTVLDASGKPVQVIDTEKKFVTVDGPIALFHSQGVADDYLKSIFGDNYKIMDRSQLFSTVENERKEAVRTAFEVLDHAKMPMSFRRVWDLKQRTGDLGFTGSPNVGTHVEGQFKNLSSALDQDIEMSMQSPLLWKNGGQDALKYYRAAKDEVASRYEKFSGGVEKLRKEAGVVPTLAKGETDVARENTVEAILKDPVELKRALRTGDRNKFGAYKIQDVLNQAYNKETGMFDPLKIKEGWEAPHIQPVLDQLYNADQRSTLNNFFSALAKGSQQQGMTGGGYQALRVIGATGSIVGGAFSPYSVAILGVGIPANIFSRTVLLNPKYAAIAARLAETPANSGEAILLSRALFTGLRGTKVMLMDGKPGTVQEDGSINPSK